MPPYDGIVQYRQMTAHETYPAIAPPERMLGISFRLKHPCVFGKLSAQFPDVTMSNWCNYALEIMEYQTRDPRVADEIQAGFTKLSRIGFKVLSRSHKGGNSQTVLMRCAHKPGQSVDELIERHAGLVLYPVVYKDGWEHYRIIALDESKVEKLFQRLRKAGELEITLKRHTEDGLLSHSFLVSTGELFAELTAKQADALKVAIAHGYYRVPRKIRFEDIAKSRKTPRTTFEEHVRKAESKIMHSLEPYISIHTRPPS